VNSSLSCRRDHVGPITDRVGPMMPPGKSARCNPAAHGL
jgi:hypothetical protein